MTIKRDMLYSSSTSLFLVAVMHQVGIKHLNKDRMSYYSKHLLCNFFFQNHCRCDNFLQVSPCPESWRSLYQAPQLFWEPAFHSYSLLPRKRSNV